ncbi:MFS transporter [Streptomyces sp. ISL-66]|uniref:MDR family MFS transporter n=1 Tax=Streptomyces sp. ISL-66 TaxID=2819186 RepID=UPI001BE5EAD1|nr:MDR family MFS transporter [Streptomyces sp. ISL-66]MBT2468880.1 MFS transporter [Streptomyces sp. ISL-66]
MDQLNAEDPTRIGPYRLIARLGAGGMGLVYLGRSEGGRTVAVKVVQADHAGNPEFRRRFAREVAAARRVGGSWTADVLDADPEAAVPWVATQYIPGPDLHTVVAKDFGPLPEHSVHTLANRLALALQAVHEAGLIHRDLKPSNVLVTVDGPRVIDFGIARAMESLAGDSLLTRTGTLIGSAGFMSPEQVRGLELTPASDVFCLGAVLVYAATGRLLFGAGDTGLNAHLFRVAEEEPDLTGVPPTLVDLVRACLHKNPAERPTPQQVAARTATDQAPEWLPGAVLAQLGRHAAQLLDYAPATPAAPPAPAAQPDPRVQPAQSYPLPPAYAPTGLQPFVPAQGFGPPPGAAWPPAPSAGPFTEPVQDSPAPHARRWRGLAVAVLVQLLVISEATVFNLATPSVHADLGLDFDAVRAVFTVYAVAFAALLLPGGHLADLLGRRTTLIIGLAGFAAASVLGASAPNSALLICARILQGVFGALLTPSALALVVAGFTDRGERRRAFGVYAAFAGGSSVLGLLAGGWLREFTSWRVSPLASVLITAIILVLTLTLPREHHGPARVRPDAPGLLLGSGALAALAYGLAEGGTRGWAVPLVLVPLVAGAALLAAFLVRQAAASGPMLPSDFFKDRDRLGCLLAMVLAGAGTVVLFSFLSSYLLYVLGHAPTPAGALLLPLFGALLVGATQVSARLAHRAAPGVLIAAGLLLTAVGMAILALLEGGDEYAAQVLPGTLLTGLGLGMALMPILATATAGIAPRHAGAASAAVLTAQQLGGTVGGLLFTAVLGASTHTGPVSVSGWTDTLWWAAGGMALAALIAGPTVRTNEPRDAVPQAAARPR